MQIVLGWSMGLALGLSTSPAGGGILSSLPDPMKLDPYQIGFVMVLVTILFLYLKIVFFKPMVSLMDQRDRDIAAGVDSRAQATALAEKRQAEYDERMKVLRARTFERRKALSDAAQQEREALILRSRTESATLRDAASAELQSWREVAKHDLVAQVDALAESMTCRLIGQE